MKDPTPELREPAPEVKKSVQKTGPGNKQQPKGIKKTQMRRDVRGLSFEEGSALLSPKDPVSTDLAPPTRQKIPEKPIEIPDLKQDIKESDIKVEDQSPQSLVDDNDIPWRAPSDDEDDGWESEEDIGRSYVPPPEMKKKKKKKGLKRWIKEQWKKFQDAFSSKKEDKGETLQDEFGDNKDDEWKVEPGFADDNFEIIEVLGKGGKSRVFKANLKVGENEDLPIALKIATGEKQNETEAFDMLFQEAKTYEAIGSVDDKDRKHLVTMLGRTEMKGKAGLLIDLCEHGEMKDAFGLLEHAGVTEEERMIVIRHLMKGSLKGLSAMHKSGLVHNDFKADNVFLTKDFTPKVGDFDTTRSTQELEDDPDVPGTATHMPPEFLSRGGASKEGDIWAYGETLLLATEGKNSVDIKGGADPRYGHEFAKSQWNQKDVEEWQRKLGQDTRYPDEGKDEYLDFVKQAMALDPQERGEASTLLNHPFLRYDEDHARELLRIAFLKDAGEKRRQLDALRQRRRPEGDQNE